MWKYGLSIVILSVWVGNQTGVSADRPEFKPVPRMQTIPLPEDQVSFQWDGREITRYYYGSSLRRPFMYPLIGPAGRSLTRMGHPHDQESHKHHYSFWVSHNDVNGVDFWSESGGGTIVHKKILAFEDGEEGCYTLTENDWVDSLQNILLHETRRISIYPRADRQWLLVLDLDFSPDKGDVTFGDSSFGLVGVRMAKPIGVNDGGGLIRNSEGLIDEEAIFHQRAKWVDYSGRITNNAIEGIALFDHPKNPNFPSPFHVRNDGWMGACLSHQAPRLLKPGETLHLRYGLFIHSQVAPVNEIGEQWQSFSELP